MKLTNLPNMNARASAFWRKEAAAHVAAGCGYGRTVSREARAAGQNVDDVLACFLAQGGNPWVIVADVRHYEQFARAQDRRALATTPMFPAWLENEWRRERLLDLRFAKTLVREEREAVASHRAHREANPDQHHGCLWCFDGRAAHFASDVRRSYSAGIVQAYLDIANRYERRFT